MSGRDWDVVVTEDGRPGTVIYREPGQELRFWWEFGGGDAVAMISVGTDAEWAERHPWVGARRQEIIGRVTEEVIRQRAPSCKGTLDDRGWITLTPRDAPAGGTSAPRGAPPPRAASARATGRERQPSRCRRLARGAPLRRLQPKVFHRGHRRRRPHWP